MTPKQSDMYVKFFKSLFFAADCSLGVGKVSTPKVDDMPNVFEITKCEKSQNFVKINEYENLWGI